MQRSEQHAFPPERGRGNQERTTKYSASAVEERRWDASRYKLDQRESECVPSGLLVIANLTFSVSLKFALYHYDLSAGISFDIKTPAYCMSM